MDPAHPQFNQVPHNAVLLTPALHLDFCAHRNRHRKCHNNFTQNTRQAPRALH
jgi:hypothetical protein